MVVECTNRKSSPHMQVASEESITAQQYKQLGYRGLKKKKTSSPDDVIWCESLRRKGDAAKLFRPGERVGAVRYYRMLRYHVRVLPCVWTQDGTLLPHSQESAAIF